MDFSYSHYPGRVSLERSAAKAITWRVVGTVSLWFTVYIFTGEMMLASGLSIVDVVSNTILYYCHERIWDWTDWGRKFIDGRFEERRKRMLAKSFSWRVLASLYLFFIIHYFSDQVFFISSGIVIADALLNIVEYYFHEYSWNKVRWGRIRRTENNN